MTETDDQNKRVEQREISLVEKLLVPGKDIKSQLIAEIVLLLALHNIIVKFLRRYYRFTKIEGRFI